METKIELREMRFYAHHGVGEQETVVGNWFTVDLTLEAPLEGAVESDDLSATINYAEAYEVVKAEMAVPSKLIEHVAGRIMRALKARDGDKAKVTLRFRGREMAHQHFGTELMERVRNELADIAQVEHAPKLEGRQMVMVLAPKKKR